jgi:hypothetical protein
MAARATEDVLTDLSIRTLEALDGVAEWIQNLDWSTVTPEEVQAMRDRLQRVEKAAARVQERMAGDHNAWD